MNELADKIKHVSKTNIVYVISSVSRRILISARQYKESLMVSLDVQVTIMVILAFFDRTSTGKDHGYSARIPTSKK